MKGIVGKKLGMSQAFDDAGVRHALTVIQVEPGVIVRVKNTETDGYSAIQVGFGACDPKKLNRPRAGVFKKALQTKDAFRVLKEFRIEDVAGYKVGQELTVEIFSAGEKVDVQGTSIGKGFSGRIKRFHHTRGPMTHGSKNRRESGSIGTSAKPSHVLKGRPMAGHLGAKTSTTQNLQVYRVDAEKNLLFIEGGVPGWRDQMVTVRETTKRKRPAAK